MWRKLLHLHFLSTSSQIYFFGILLCVCSASMIMMVRMNDVTLSFILETESMPQPRIVNWTQCLSDDDYEMYFETSTIITTMSTMANTTSTTPNADYFPKSKFNKDRLLSAFDYGNLLYLVTHTMSQIPGGIISDRLGGKELIFIGITASGLVNFVYPLAIYYEPYLTIPLQILNGFSMGVYFPSLVSIIARWGTPDKRASMTGLSFSGISFALALTYWFGPYLMITCGWEFGYVIPGIFCLMAALLFYTWVFSDPDSHPFLTDEQRLKVTENISVLPRHEMAPVPWVKIATTIHVWAILICFWGHKWSQKAMLVDLPIYVERLIDKPLYKPGIIGALPFLLMGTTCAAGGFFEDFLIRKLKITVNNCRNVFMGFACFIPAICCLVASYQGCSLGRIYVLFVVGHMGWGLLYASLQVCVIDVGPNYAGTMMGIVNCFGQTAFLAAEYCSSLITKENTIESWQSVFWISYLIVGFSYLFAIHFGKFEVQKWNNKKMKSYKR